MKPLLAGSRAAFLTSGLILAVLAAGCTPPRRPDPVRPAPRAVHRMDRRERLLRLVRPHLGKPHCMGGQGPRCFDCSGLAREVFAALGVRLPRRSADQARMGRALPRRMDALQAGDLIFFDWNGGGVDHVGIYVGRGEFAHASRKRGVVIEALAVDWYWPEVVALRRLLD